MASKNKRKSWKRRLHRASEEKMADQSVPNSHNQPTGISQSQPVPGISDSWNKEQEKSGTSHTPISKAKFVGKTKLGSLDVINSIMLGNVPSPRITRSKTSQESHQESQGLNLSGATGDMSTVAHPDVPPLTKFTSLLCLPTTSHLAHSGSEFDLNKIESLIDEKDRGDTGAISDALNKMYVMMVTNQLSMASYIAHCDRRFEDLGTRVDSLDEKITSIDNKIHDQLIKISTLQTDKVSKQEFDSLKGELNDLKNYVLKTNVKSDEKLVSFDSALKAQNQDGNESKLEIKHLYNNEAAIVERLNARDIKDNRLLFIIDGLPEGDGKETTTQSLVSRFNEDASSDLKAEDFVSAYRLGKLKSVPEGQSPPPRQIKVRLRNDEVRDSFLACRGKLKPNVDKSVIWVNEDHPDEYRRRKTMLRELVKHINKNTSHKAAIEAGGLKLDGYLYMPGQFDDLPEDCHPERVQVLSTKYDGIAFAGQWAYLSNMFHCSFRYEETVFSSSEQCFQYYKALQHKDLVRAKEIILTNDPFKCKKIGGAINPNKEWSDSRESTLLGIIKCKFEQNDLLLSKLIGTGNKLFEATVGNYWGTNTGLRSRATREHTGSGQNRFGLMLEKLRGEFVPQPPPEASEA